MICYFLFLFTIMEQLKEIIDTNEYIEIEMVPSSYNSKVITLTTFENKKKEFKFKISSNSQSLQLLKSQYPFLLHS